MGPYRLVRELGRGGMGVVYEAIHERSQETVACKVIADYLANDTQMRRRFDSEVTTLLRLKHPNIVQIIGFGEEKGRLFYVMEYVDGENLHQRLQREKRLEWQTMLDWAIDVCGALKHAHDFGIIHRDLKTANLMINKTEVIKLTDFGIGKIFGAVASTNPGSVVGTADFMSPEQAEGNDVTVRSDLYAFGAICYAALCGKTPFTGKNTPEILFNVRYGTYLPVQKLAPKTPTDFAILIDELLSRDPDSRPPTAFLVGNRLKAMRAGLTKYGDSPRSKTDKQHDSPPSPAADQDPYAGLTSIDMSDYPSIADLSAPNLNDATRIGRQPSSHQKNTPTNRRSDPKGPDVNGLDSSNSIAGPNDLTREVPSSEGEDHEESTPLRRDSYTVATEEERNRAIHGRNPQSEPWHWQQVASIVALLATIGLCIGLAVWFSRPPSADRIWNQILPAIQSGNDEQLLTVSDLAETFLTLYPDDPRADQAKQLVENSRTFDLFKQLEKRASNPGLERMDSLEQPLLAALRLARVDPEQAERRLNALMMIFENAEGLSKSQRNLLDSVRLARSRLLESPPNSEVPQARKNLEQRLVWAEANLDPQRRTAFYENILLLYSDLPWAKPIVETARSRLNDITPTAP